MFSVLLTLGWLACVIYSTIPSFWLLIHPRTDYWRSRQWSPYAALLPAWIGMWGLVALVTLPWRWTVFYRHILSWVPAAVLFAIGLLLYRQSAKGFKAAQLGGLPEVLPGQDGQQLVMSGIRQRIRHPVYLAHLCEMLAWSIGTGLMVCYCLTVFAVVTGVVMIRAEDRELERRFGEQYREYCQRVPAVLFFRRG